MANVCISYQIQFYRKINIFISSSPYFLSWNRGNFRTELRSRYFSFCLGIGSNSCPCTAPGCKSFSADFASILPYFLAICVSLYRQYWLLSGNSPWMYLAKLHGAYQHNQHFVEYSPLPFLLRNGHFAHLWAFLNFQIWRHDDVTNKNYDVMMTLWWRNDDVMMT